MDAQNGVTRVLEPVFRAVGPIFTGLALFVLPLFLAPTPVEAADPEDCGGYDTVECEMEQWCIGIRWIGFEYCKSVTRYWPPEDLRRLLKYGYDFEGSGGGAF